MERRLRKLTLCFDLAGCPNRCLHCWLGDMPSPRLTRDDLRTAAASFRPLAEKLEVVSWVREPDFPNDYRELWALESALSDEKTPHFELMSLHRAARDDAYLPWLREQGVRAVQLTLFGGQALTDRYTGRKGTYAELKRVIPKLLETGIEPRLQTFLNRETIDGMEEVVRLAEEFALPQRLGFAAFAHAGSCDGRNAALYPLRATREEVKRLPPRLKAWTEAYLRRPLDEVFGRTEREWCERFAQDDTPVGVETSDTVTLYVDGNGAVYPNLTAPTKPWCLGHLGLDSPAEMLARLERCKTPGLHIQSTMPKSELSRCFGNAAGEGLFTQEDMLAYWVNRAASA